MRQRRSKINWFLVVLVLVLIAVVTYVDRFVLPAMQSPFLPTPTVTRDPESFVTEAQALFEQGKLLQAIETYQQAIIVNPSDPALYIAVARVQVFAGKYDDALTNSENALLLNSNNSMAHAIRGWALTQKGDYTNADISIKRALELDPNNGIAHAYNAFLLGDMAVANVGPYVNPIENAIAESNVAITLAPNSLEAHWARAYILDITDNRELAVTEYLNAISLNPNISQLHLNLGVSYKGLGIIDKAVEEYTRASTLNPSDYLPDLYSSRAEASIGEYGKATQYAEQAVKNAPTDPYLRGNWGYMLFKNYEWPNSAKQLALAVTGGQSEDGQAIKPLPLTGDDAWVAQYYYTYAVLLAQLDRCAEALPLTQTILAAVPSNEYAVYNATFTQDLCAQKMGTSTVQPTATPEVTLTP
jgi:tetratricopeptide (TPR) repeat protein